MLTLLFDFKSNAIVTSLLELLGNASPNENEFGTSLTPILVYDNLIPASK